MRVAALKPAAHRSGLRRLRTARGFAAVLMMVVYLLAGALHGVCDLDVANPIGKGAVTMTAATDIDASGKAVAAEHHCHGCFSVSVPAPLLAGIVIEPKPATPAAPRADGAGLVPGIDTPPPKFLS
jgi:hypothetical protein